MGSNISKKNKKVKRHTITGFHTTHLNMSVRDLSNDIKDLDSDDDDDDYTREYSVSRSMERSLTKPSAIDDKKYKNEYSVSRSIERSLSKTKDTKYIFYVKTNKNEDDNVNYIYDSTISPSATKVNSLCDTTDDNLSTKYGSLTDMNSHIFTKSIESSVSSLNGNKENAKKMNRRKMSKLQHTLSSLKDATN